MKKQSKQQKRENPYFLSIFTQIYICLFVVVFCCLKSKKHIMCFCVGVSVKILFVYVSNTHVSVLYPLKRRVVFFIVSSPSASYTDNRVATTSLIHTTLKESLESSTRELLTYTHFTCRIYGDTKHFFGQFLYCFNSQQEKKYKPLLLLQKFRKGD